MNRMAYLVATCLALCACGPEDGGYIGLSGSEDANSIAADPAGNAYATPAVAADNAAFISQTVPAFLTTGETRTVSVTLRNNGTTTWTRNGDLGYKLGSQNPQDNAFWVWAG